jgi:hypothetical protein
MRFWSLPLQANEQGISRTACRRTCNEWRFVPYASFLVHYKKQEASTSTLLFKWPFWSKLVCCDKAQLSLDQVVAEVMVYSLHPMELLQQGRQHHGRSTLIRIGIGRQCVAKVDHCLWWVNHKSTSSRQICRFRLLLGHLEEAFESFQMAWTMYEALWEHPEKLFDSDDIECRYAKVYTKVAMMIITSMDPMHQQQERVDDLMNEYSGT